MRLSEASEKLLIPKHRLLYWKNHGLLSDAEELDFSDLVKARFIQRCRSSGVSLQALRNRLERLKSEGKDWPAQLYLDPGHRLLELVDASRAIDPESQQFYFCFEKKGGNDPIEFAADSQEKLDFPHQEAYLQALAQGDTRKMEAILKQSLEEDPKNLSVKIELGNLAYEQGDFPQARHWYEDALKQSPECVEALYNLANIHLKERRYAAAIRCYRSSIAMDPNFAEGYYNLGLLLLSLNYRRQAMECMEIYCRLDPDSEWGREAAQLLLDLKQHESLSAEIIENPPQLFPAGEE